MPAQFPDTPFPANEPFPSEPVDIADFPVGKNIGYEDDDELSGLRELEAQAWSFARMVNWNPPIAEMVLAFGLAPIIGIFLMRFEPGGRPWDAERWVVVGDLPSMHFETDEAPTPALALQAYCMIAQDWADNVLAHSDLSDSYPIPVDPTVEHAEMLLSRIDTLRRTFLPEAIGRSSASGRWRGAKPPPALTPPAGP